MRGRKRQESRATHAHYLFCTQQAATLFWHMVVNNFWESGAYAHLIFKATLRALAPSVDVWVCEWAWVHLRHWTPGITAKPCNALKGLLWMCEPSTSRGHLWLINNNKHALNITANDHDQHFNKPFMATLRHGARTHSSILLYIITCVHIICMNVVPADSMGKKLEVGTGEIFPQFVFLMEETGK